MSRTDSKDNVVSFREEALKGSRSVLDELVRDGARRILRQALELEIQEFLERHLTLRDEQGHQAVVSNDYPLERKIVSGVRRLPGRPRGCGSRMATLTMVYKLAAEAERSWRQQLEGSS